MKRLLLASTIMTAVIATSSVSHAANGDWSGWYLGGHAGGTWLDGDDISFPGGGIDGSGFIGGALTGYNFQSGNLVFGVEGDISFADIDASNSLFIQDLDIDVMGTIRGRLGYAIDQFLLFGTAGVAIAGIDAVHTPVIPGTNASKTHVGFVVGGGVEWAVWDNLIVRAEYLYSDLGEETYGFSAAAAPDPHRIDIDELHIVRGAVIWRFGPIFGGL